MGSAHGGWSSTEVYTVQGRHSPPRAKTLGLLAALQGTIPGGLYISPGKLVALQSVTLLANLGHLVSQEDVGRDWQEVCSFATDVASRAEIGVGPCLLPLNVTCLLHCL